MTWRRSDLGDVPEPESVISMIVFSDREGMAPVTQYARFRVATVLTRRGVPRIYGAGLQPQGDIDWPSRPDNIVGQAVLWRYTE